MVKLELTEIACTAPQRSAQDPYPHGHAGSFAHEQELHAPFGIAPHRGPGNGEIGRAIISAVLSELMRH